MLAKAHKDTADNMIKVLLVCSFYTASEVALFLHCVAVLATCLALKGKIMCKVIKKIADHV